VTAAISQLRPSQIWQRLEKVTLRSPRSILLKYLLSKPHRSQKSFCFRPNSFREAFMRRPSLNSSTFVIVIFVSSFAKSPGFSENRLKALAPGTLSLANTLDGFPRILPYCYRPDAVASMYAHGTSPNPLGHGNQES
jgi:hypothetical protein